MADVTVGFEQSVKSRKTPIEDAAKQKAQWIREIAGESPLSLLVNNYVIEPKPFPPLNYYEQKVDGVPPGVIIGPMRPPQSGGGAETDFWTRLTPSQISLEGRRGQRLSIRGRSAVVTMGPVRAGEITSQSSAFAQIARLKPAAYKEQETRPVRVPYWTGAQIPPPGLIPGGVMRAGVPCLQRAPESNQGICSFADLDSLPDSVIAVLKNKRHRRVEELEDLEDLVRYVEGRLIPIPGDVATTLHGDECLKANPRSSAH